MTRRACKVLSDRQRYGKEVVQEGTPGFRMIGQAVWMARKEGEMKKPARLAMAALVLLVLSHSQSLGGDYTKDPRGFRGHIWGTSEKEVRENENWEFVGEKDNRIGYKGEIAGLPVFATYVFAQDKLVKGVYFFIQEHTNLNLYLNDFYRIRDLLFEKYGASTGTEMIWNRDLYKKNKTKWGFAIARGDLTVITRWEFLDTKIMLMLYGDNFDVRMSLEYASKGFAPLLENTSKQQSLKDL